MIFNDKNSILLSKRLKELREEKKLSHEKLCEQLQQAGVKVGLQSLKNFEVTEKRHSKFEAAKGMKVETLFNLAEFYGVSVDYLLGRAETKSIDNKVQAACEVTGLKERSVQLISIYSRIFSEELNFVFQDYDFYELIKFLKTYAIAYKSKYNSDRNIFDETTVEAISFLELQGFVVMTNAENNLYQCEQSFMESALQILADIESLCDDEEFDIYKEYKKRQKEKTPKMIKPKNTLIKENEENAEHNPKKE